jgi:hypothetical protein
MRQPTLVAKRLAQPDDIGGRCSRLHWGGVQLDECAFPMARNREKSDDPWYAKVVFGLFLFVLVGSLVALYSGVPVVQFVTRGL